MHRLITKTTLKNAHVAFKPPGLIKPTYIDIRNKANIKLPANLTIIAPDLSIPNFFKNTLVPTIVWKEYIPIPAKCNKKIIK